MVLGDLVDVAFSALIIVILVIFGAGEGGRVERVLLDDSVMGNPEDVATVNGMRTAAV